MGKILDFQDFNIYSAEDHETWRVLCGRLRQSNKNYFANEYLIGLEKLELDTDKIINISEVSNRLKMISGWTLVPVSGLLPTKDFFYLLVKKIYPVTIYIRNRSEIDFSEQPDIFHDVFGHLSMLTNEKFSKFLTAYSTIALKNIENDSVVDHLGRLYWFTYEMGLLKDGEDFRSYGGAIITSAEEILNVKNVSIPKHVFNLNQIINTEFNSFKIQKEYFVIDSFDDLFNCLEDLEIKLNENLCIPDSDGVLKNYSLNPHIEKNFNDVIGFLNGVQFKYPHAFSFVAGQPDVTFFDIENHIDKFNVFVEHLAKLNGENRKDIINSIGQYNKTKGIINEIVSEYLKNDENINIKAEHLLMTVGAQEAFAIIVSSICDRNNDVILVENPSYIGISSFANIFDYNIEGVAIHNDGIDLNLLASNIVSLNKAGKVVKLVYVIPDYQNPSGSCMPIENRLLLLELAEKYNFLIIEDSVYNSFTYSEKKNPTLKSLDKLKRVIYVGSFSKSLFPGLRIGLIAADQLIEKQDGNVVNLIDEMTKVKAQLTNNTSTISQAILGGVLLDLKCTLSDWNRPKYESYKIKRNCMIDALNAFIGSYSESWSKQIHWNKPDGGFFIKMSVPFIIDNNSVVESASKYNVIFCPMRYFYVDGGGQNEIRLTFSNLSLEQIREGVKKLSYYLKYRVEHETAKKNRKLVLNK